MKTIFLFQAWPYIAFALFVMGFAVRFAFSRNGAAASSSELQDDRGRSLKFGLWALFLGHLAGLIFPRQILLWNTVPLRLYVLEGFALAAGLVALAGWGVLMWRHLGPSQGSIAGQMADLVFLSFLFVALLSGLVLAIVYRWGSTWGVATLTPYAFSLLRGSPAASILAGMPFLVQLHVFSAFTTLVALPFSRLGLLLIFSFSRVRNLVLRPASVLALGGRWSGLDGMLRRYKTATWLWPEED